MSCVDCAYFWREENEDYSCCHWQSRCPDDMAPCEYEDDYEDSYNDIDEKAWAELYAEFYN